MNKNKNKKLNRHLEALKIAYGIARKSGSIGPMILLVTRNAYHYKGMSFRGTLADYVEFCRMNDIKVQIRWSEILG